MNENRSKTDSRNVPLMPSVARRIMEELFRIKNQWKTGELAAEVERIHLEREGLKGRQDLRSIVNKALRMLQEDKKVESPAYGVQRWVSSDDEPLASASVEGIVPEITALASGDVNDEEFAPQKEVGEGPETVYVYYNPNDRKLAELEGRRMWECKVGRTANVDASGRLIGQGVRTALSRFPVVGLVIRTQDAVALEKALHASLRLMEREVEDSVGTEWFMTSPEFIETWYTSFQAALTQLAEKCTTKGD